MALTKTLKDEIYHFLKEKVLKKIKDYNLKSEDASKPFQYALFTKDDYLEKGFIHGCETALGNWHEQIARLIARENFQDARKLGGASKLEGKITRKAEEIFGQILNDLDNLTRKPNHKSEVKDIFDASQGEGEINRSQTVDLYLKTNAGQEIYFEIKGPKPNKNEMRAAKRDLFEIFSMRANEGRKVKVYLGMYYNPYAPKEYERWTCLRFFEKGQDFLIGKDFWDFLGGASAYEDIIDIYKKVGKEIRPVLLRKLKDIKSQ